MDAESLLARLSERGEGKSDVALTEQDLVDVLTEAIEQGRPFVVGVGDADNAGAFILPSNDRHFEWWAQVMRGVADKHLERWTETGEEK